MNENQHPKQGPNSPGSSDQTITVKIQTAQGEFVRDFDKNQTIQDIIQAVKAHFNFSADGTYELRLKGSSDDPFMPQRPIVSYGLKDGAVLVFTDLGKAA
ncbi:hypothetical protein GCM10023189_32840 [Nibrella saemangeumensis]|uniref:Ubiquitin-like domain-containing protein n=1 Tax=Nibrella saemangeumensis TaxID=1084526 RepID=A0ABP8N0M9_9BACT